MLRTNVRKTRSRILTPARSFRFEEYRGDAGLHGDGELGATSREAAMGALREAARLRSAEYCASKVAPEK